MAESSPGAEPEGASADQLIEELSFPAKHQAALVERLRAKLDSSHAQKDEEIALLKSLLRVRAPRLSRPMRTLRGWQMRGWSFMLRLIP